MGPKLKLHTQILLGMAAGIFVGLLLGEKAVMVAPLGKIFISLLKMLIMPLILASIVTGIVSIGDVKNLGRIGGKTLVYYLGTTFTATFIGLVMVNLLHPGAGMIQVGGTGTTLTRSTPPLSCPCLWRWSLATFSKPWQKTRYSPPSSSQSFWGAP